jgi:hypothetical protein
MASSTMRMKEPSNACRGSRFCGGSLPKGSGRGSMWDTTNLVVVILLLVLSLCAVGTITQPSVSLRCYFQTLSAFASTNFKPSTAAIWFALS